MFSNITPVSSPETWGFSPPPTHLRNSGVFMRPPSPQAGVRVDSTPSFLFFSLFGWHVYLPLSATSPLGFSSNTACSLQDIPQGVVFDTVSLPRYVFFAVPATFSSAHRRSLPTSRGIILSSRSLCWSFYVIYAMVINPYVQKC